MRYEINLHIFGERLTQAMNENGIDKRQLYNALNPDDRIKKDQKGQYVTDRLRNIDNWMNGVCYPKNIAVVLKLCNILNCDLEYLFCETLDSDCLTHETQFIHDKTGLSAKAIEKIVRWHNDLGSDTLNSSVWIDFISEMIHNENADRFLEELHQTIIDKQLDTDFLTNTQILALSERQVRNYRNTNNGNMYALSQIYNEIITKLIADKSDNVQSNS